MRGESPSPRPLPVRTGRGRRESAASHSRGTMRPRFAKRLRHQEIRGRGECRVPNAPAASCALCSFSMHTSIHSGGTGNIRHSPRSGFNSCSALSPGTIAWLPPSSAKLLPPTWRLLWSARTTRLDRPPRAPPVLRRRCVHRIPPRVRDVLEPPLCGVGQREQITVSDFRKDKYFCGRSGQPKSR
jgi:hypothetical protein